MDNGIKLEIAICFANLIAVQTAVFALVIYRYFSLKQATDILQQAAEIILENYLQKNQKNKDFKMPKCRQDVAKS